jgi:hypothetical protein
VVSVPKADNSNDAILFRTSVANSRAITVKTDNLTEFWAGALRVDGVQNNAPVWGGFKKFTKDSKTNVFSPETTVTWGTDALKFFATNIDFSKRENLAMLTLPTTDENSTPKVYYTMPSKVAEQQDIVYATNRGSRSDFSNVTSIPLDFRHALCQIVVKAANNMSDYEIRVKGYKIYKAGFNVGTFVMPNPVNIGGVSADSTVVSPVGSWSFSDANKKTATTIYSGTYGGYTVTANDDSDTNGSFINLTGDATDIKGTAAGDTDEGLAMAIPINTEGTAENDLQFITGWHLGTGGNANNDGTYIALLVQIDDKYGNPVFPAVAASGKRMAYRGLPKYYGYVIAPVTIKWEAGKKYTYTLNFQDGLGIMDPYHPDPVDPDNDEYDPSKDDGEGDNPNPGTDTDPKDKGENVLEGTISFTLDVSDWDKTFTNSTTAVGM